MSRSAFALRFKELLGETPLEYLTNWRMYKAIGSLQKDDRKLFEIAKSVGYDSDAAFSKAFKRVLGVAPRNIDEAPGRRVELRRQCRFVSGWSATLTLGLLQGCPWLGHNPCIAG